MQSVSLQGYAMAPSQAWLKVRSGLTLKGHSA